MLSIILTYQLGFTPEIGQKRLSPSSNSINENGFPQVSFTASMVSKFVNGSHVSMYKLFCSDKLI